MFLYSNTNQTITSVYVLSGITVTTLNNAEMAVGEIFIVNANGSDYVFKCKLILINRESNRSESIRKAGLEDCYKS